MCSIRKRKGDHRMIRSKVRRVLSLLLVLLLLLGNTTVFAADMEDVPYYSYCYWEGPSRYEAVPTRAMYEAFEQINGDSLGIDNIVNARFVTLSQDEKELYVLDSGNSRILVIDTETFALKKEISTIPFSKTDYAIAKHTNKVKANTDYVLFWWSKYDSGKGNLTLSVYNEDNGSAIAYKGEAFEKFRGDAMEDSEGEWLKHVFTFNSGKATNLTVEINQESDERCVFYLDNAFLIEKSVMEAATVSYRVDGPVYLENVNDESGDGVYKLVTTVNVGDKTTERAYNLIVDGYYQSSYQPVADVINKVFSGKGNLYDQVLNSDFTPDLEPSEREAGLWDVSLYVTDTDDVAILTEDVTAIKAELQKILLKDTLAQVEAVFATDFNNDMGNWIGECGSSHDITVDADAQTDAGSLKMESTLSYVDAEGLYVSAEGEIYLADTENFRVLIIGADGHLRRQLLKPTGVGVPTDLEYKPKRVVMDNKGYLYVISSGCFYGMLVYDTDEVFKGFHGSYKVEQGVLDTIKGWITDLFMTDEKNAQTQAKLPAEILDFSIDSEGMLYTLSAGSFGQVKRLGLNGNQTLNHKFGFQSQSGDLINFSEQPAEYWHNHDQYKVGLAAISVDPSGFSYVLDKLRGRIFMYDEECRVISIFATGFKEGNQVGTFETLESIATSDDRLYTLDFNTGTVTVFRLTDYGRLFKDADVLTIAGEYEQALPKWREVLKLDANNQRAYEGVGKALLTMANEQKKAGNTELANQYFDEAMKYAELGNDQQTYSQAFSVVQKQWMTNNFWWIFLLCLALVGGVAALLVLSKKRKLINIKNDKLRVALSVPFHPFQAFQNMKDQKLTSGRLSLIFLLIFYLASVSEDLYGGFMYVIVDTANYNAIYTLIGSVGVLLLWVIANWGICILNEGKGSLKEVFTMSAYSMTPMIAFSVIFVIGSHVMAASETSTFGLIGTIMFIYTALLLLIGMTVVHEYTFFKSMKMAILTILGMVLTAFVIFSVILLTQQFITFFVNIFDELAKR